MKRKISLLLLLEAIIVPSLLSLIRYLIYLTSSRFENVKVGLVFHVVETVELYISFLFLAGLVNIIISVIFLLVHRKDNKKTKLRQWLIFSIVTAVTAAVLSILLSLLSIFPCAKPF